MSNRVSELGGSELVVGLDQRGLDPLYRGHFGRGTGRYVASLSERLMGRTAGSVSVKGLSSEQLSTGKVGEFIRRFSPAGKVTLENQFALPLQLSRIGVDLIHFFHHGDAPSWSPTPYVVSVLDLIPLKFAALYKAQQPGWRFNLARFLELQAIKSAIGIIAISEATKRDIVALLGVNPDRIKVTPLGVDGRLVRPRTIVSINERIKSQARAELKLPEDRPLMIYLGGIDQRKNIRFLLEVVKEVVVSSPTDERPLLAFAGRIEDEANYPKLLADIKELGLEDSVKLLGFLPDAKLRAFFQGADLMVFPSLYEGFGLPVLEAMVGGVPVVAGNNSSMPEVAGKNAVLLPDNDRAAWAREILALLASPSRRQELSYLGQEWASKFTWERTAEETLKAYEYFWSRKNKTNSPDSRKSNGELELQNHR